MIGKAAKRSDRRGIRHVRAQAEGLPLRSGAMDPVFAGFVYHHLGDKAAALGECARVLAPGGRLMISTPSRETLASYLWMRFFPTAVRVDRERMPSRAGLIETVCRASFEAERRSARRRPD